MLGKFREIIYVHEPYALDIFHVFFDIVRNSKVDKQARLSGFQRLSERSCRESVMRTCCCAYNAVSLVREPVSLRIGDCSYVVKVCSKSLAPHGRSNAYVFV